MLLELMTKQVANLCRAVGSYIKRASVDIKDLKIKDKGTHNFVTRVDVESERRLVEELRKILPAAGFIAEENSDLPQGEEYNWIIDPLDGTTNFIHQAPPFSISVALSGKEGLLLGVVYEVVHNECFYAWKGGGCYLNGHPVKVSEVSAMDDALVATGFPYSDFSRLENYLEAFTFMMKSTHGVRRLGSAAADLAYVACGRYDAFFEYGLKPWDVAAGSLLVSEAGGKVSDFSGGDNFLFGGEMIAAGSNLFEIFQKETGAFFKK
ncbi:MAG: inositol monophosphatase family protein [Bacteroidales bacterium]